MIYMDNAATSFPKAPGVGEAMQHYVNRIGVNINRSVYGPAQEAGLKTLILREQLSEFFHHDEPTRVILTAGNTASLNLAIKGRVKPGDHVLVSSMEHNAVMRPLVQMGIDFDRIPGDSEGYVQVDKIDALLRPNTRLVVICHGSNVCGCIQNIAKIGELCKLHNIPLVLDAAQTAGHIPIDFQALGLSALTVPGHKGLLGPQGIGALLLSEEFAKGLDPLIAGGTGSMSDSEELPPYLPDRFESGTPNLPGIYGWSAAMEYVANTFPQRQAREEALTAQFLQGLSAMSHVQVIGPKALKNRTGVIAVDFLNMDNAEAADELEQRFGILTRCGLHCAPSAHKTLGTFPRGVVRFSIGPNTTEEEVRQTLEAIKKIDN
ncbi:MAG: aminotransferase class V-fold PLP-dependent enzyme [Oscillospiraceae bacterium]|nr:aminotransferase class V-fold PLP-dependent enzyme [Oscillospiraceae bacterium]